MQARSGGKAFAGAALVAGIALLAGCASKRQARPEQPSAARPVPPAGAATNLVVPPADGQGGYRTINDGLGQDEAVWHLRSALNVAALSCSGTNIPADYNALLTQRKSLFAKAYAAEVAGHRSGGNIALDRHMTQLYNFYAQPPAQAGFCAVARDVATEARGVGTGAFPAFAMSALARLERPFDDFYRAYDDYRVQLAAWERGDQVRTAAVPAARAAPTALAAASPAPKQAAAAASRADAMDASSASWRIQLGAFSGEDAAQGAWRKISARMADVAGFKPRYEAVPGKKLVRVQVGPLGSRADSIRLCAAAAAAGFDCFPVVAS
ncbi:SPOR domain-containing protein [Edaphosphingomonas haloaromaticamans]|uniref:Sporulation related domain protein n=1 Tax=Edaphosphingomonas haloaromaticamans TaxID=653954 RepID=A0A1S1HGZ6_9SPHN|nr:SPOR domain-containing protein [Sphingomonas haloaromaticamans]OHT19800.1 Sporulation related domain protein [Sphingomonas haloaromaticamans]